MSSIRLPNSFSIFTSKSLKREITQNQVFDQRMTLNPPFGTFLTDSFGEVPSTIHEKAVQLMRLLVANHPFVDGNKRTALRTVVVFYILNGYTFEYGDEIRALLRRFAIDEAAVDTETAVIYFRACARHN